MSNLIKDDEYWKSVCKLGQQEKCCKYLACGKDGMECLKHTSLRATIDLRDNMSAKADNCEGKGIELAPKPPSFCPRCKYAKQGFKYIRLDKKDRFDWWKCIDCDCDVGLPPEWSE